MEAITHVLEVRPDKPIGFRQTYFDETTILNIAIRSLILCIAMSFVTAYSATFLNIFVIVLMGTVFGFVGGISAYFIISIIAQICIASNKAEKKHPLLLV